MNWLKNFMTGRYGNDQLTIALLILSIIFIFTAQLSGLQIFTYISYIPVLIGFLRIFSKNIEKRRMENYKFNMLISPAYSWFKNKQKHFAKAKTHKFFKCPNCKAGLWVPKGKGSIIVTCTKCKTEFREKT